MPLRPSRGWSATLAVLAACAIACVEHREPETGGHAADDSPARAEPRAKPLPRSLHGLGYVDGMPDPGRLERRGVQVNVHDAVSPGINFYASRNQSRAQLIDEDGQELHVWEVHGDDWWAHCALQGDGDVVVVVKDRKVFRLDARSRVEWTRAGRFHHDLWVHTDGDIYALARRQREGASRHPTLPTVEDMVVVLSEDGEPKRELSVLGVLENSPHAYLLPDGRALPSLRVERSNPNPEQEYDVLHTNHVEVFDGSLADTSPLFASGNLLLSPRNIHAAMIVDPDTEEVLWLWGPSNLVYPHHPTLTAQGTILVFNNGTEQTRSQILEVDPLTNRIVWTYESDFFSLMRGSNQRLPNGNTLITQSDPGYVFEVTPTGEMVWQFLNPHIFPGKPIRMSIWRMTRHDPRSLHFDFNRGVIPPRPDGA